MNLNKPQAIVIGTSAGGLQALSLLLPLLPASLPAAVIVVCHRLQSSDNYLTEFLSSVCQMKVHDVEHLQPIKLGEIYVAPSGYHLLIADDYIFNLSADPPVNYSRPSIDVTFESAVDVYGNNLIGIILTGANSDGTKGLTQIKSVGGYTIVQDPKTASSSFMPTAAINSSQVDFIGNLEEIAQHICEYYDKRLNHNG